MEDKFKILKEKIKYFFDKNTPVHVSYKLPGKIANGYIQEQSALFFILHDFMFGDMMIFFEEIEDIIPYREKK